MDLSRTVSQINSDFSWKSPFFPHPYVYFASPLKGIPLELGIGAWDKETRMMELPGWQRNLTKSSRFEAYNIRTWWTDRQTETGRQRPRLRIASSGKKIGVILILAVSSHQEESLLSMISNMTDGRGTVRGFSVPLGVYRPVPWSNLFSLK